MVDYKYSDLYKRGSTDKQLRIEFEGGVITNTDIHSENFELHESICSESQLTFGTCESSSIKFRCSNIFRPLKGMQILVSEVIERNTDTPFVFGRYKVYSDVPTADRNWRDITAYDSMYDIVNSEVSGWYNNLSFPMTLKQFRDSFFSYFEIEQEEKNLINDSVTIEKTIESDNISGKDVITAICEINGCFGHISREGKFDYIMLEQFVSGLYPSNDLYPSDNIFPIDSKTQKIDKNTYIHCEYEDFTTQYISKLQISQQEGDIGAVIGTGSNCYIIDSNFLVYGKNSEELESIGNKLYDSIRGVSYRPFSAECVGNPCFEVGDSVKFYTKNQIVEGYILERNLKGIQSLRDTFNSEGVEFYFENINSVSADIKQLKGNTNKLTRTVDETISEIIDIENEMGSQIAQNASLIATKVTKGDISSEISQEAGKISIKSDRFSVESTHWKLSESGEQQLLDDNENVIVKIGKDGITLGNGASLISSNGVCGDLTFVSGGVPTDLGWSTAGTLVGGTNRSSVYLQATIPDNYIITNAVLTLSTVAIQYYNPVESTYFNGYSRNIKAYVGDGVIAKLVDIYGEYVYGDTGIGTQIISGGFTASGPTGSTNLYSAKIIKSGDISNFLKSGINLIKIMTDDTLGTGETDIYTHTGMATAVLSVKGYSSN